METSEIERKTPDSSMDFEFAGDASAAQEILEIEGEVRDITIIPPCIVRLIPLNSIRRL
jgi:hypothetical protein